MANRRRTSRGGKPKGFILNALWVFFILVLVVAWFRTPVPSGTEGFWNNLVARGQWIQQWVQGVTSGGSIPFPGDSGVTPGSGGNNQGGGTPNSEGVISVSPADSQQAMKDLNTIQIAEADSVAYKRTEWKQWIPAGSSCWDTREEALYRDAVPGSVKLLDAQKNPTTDKSKACSIESGQWIDPYGGDTFTNPSQLDIDHVIPLSYVAQHNGQAWSLQKKQDYANNLSYRYHLLAVSAKENRSKGDKGLSQYQPPLNKCMYATAWVNVSKTWGLSMTASDKTALEGMFTTCPK